MTEPRITQGKSWALGAPVISCVFNEDGIGAFACGDGTVRLFADERDPVAVEAHKGAVLSLCMHPQDGFLSGGDDGRLVHVLPGEGSTEIFHQKGKWIENIAASEATGLIACTAGKDAVVLDGKQPVRFTHATTATGVAFDPKGRRLAVSHYNGASLWWTKSSSQAPSVMNWKGSHLGVMWSPDGKFLVTSMQEPALHGWRVEDAADMRMTGYPARIKSMAWEHRGNQKYYYRKKRVGQHVVSEYMGTGSLAELFLAMDTEDRIERCLTRAEWAKERMEANNLEADIEHLNEIVCGLVRAALLVSGYRSHKGQWRKARHV